MYSRLLRIQLMSITNNNPNRTTIRTKSRLNHTRTTDMAAMEEVDRQPNPMGRVRRSLK